jgi:hypothetical protein
MEMMEQLGGQVTPKHNWLRVFRLLCLGGIQFYREAKIPVNPNSARVLYTFILQFKTCFLLHIPIKSTCTSSSNPLLYISRITTLRSLQHLSPGGLQHSLLPLPLPPNLQAPLAIPPTPLLLLLQLAQLLQLHLRRLAWRRLRL